MLCDDVFEEGVDTLVDALRGELGGEGKVEATLGACAPAAVGGGEGCFGFSHAHGCFDDVVLRGF